MVRGCRWSGLPSVKLNYINYMGWRRAAYMQRARTSLLSHCGWLCRSGSSFVACWPGPTNSHTACWRAPTTAHRNTNQQDQCQSRAQPTACVARPTASPRRRESVGHFSRAHPGHFSRASKQIVLQLGPEEVAAAAFPRAHQAVGSPAVAFPLACIRALRSSIAASKIPNSRRECAGDPRR